MTDIIASNKLTVVVGLGVTGLSVARFLSSRGEAFVVADSREAPPALDQLKTLMPDVQIDLGRLDDALLSGAGQLIVSPGLALSTPALVNAAKSGVNIYGDIELFARHAKAPIVAITGSNGKSTVTTLLGEMARLAGRNVGVGGNLGVPALDLLDDARDLYVLELSSFQLETIEKLGAEVAVVLNVSPDHMDRYASLADYHRAKHRVFKGVKQVLINRDDNLSQPLLGEGIPTWSFGLGKPDFSGFGLLAHQGELYLAFEFEPLLALSDMAIKGQHNIANALAALALGHAVGLPQKAMIEAVRVFPGLAHRCQSIAQRHGVSWIDDSKATNTGATVAAIEGLSFRQAAPNTAAFKNSSLKKAPLKTARHSSDHKRQENIVLVAGGQAKGQDFSALAEVLMGRVKHVVLIGEDAGQLAQAFKNKVACVSASSMEEAVCLADELAARGDTVLLSPACASFDMFSGFEERGRCFAEAVGALP